jgi:hypothetical protein
VQLYIRRRHVAPHIKGKELHPVILPKIEFYARQNLAAKTCISSARH